MVVVKIELWPGGDEKKAQLLQSMTITNDGTGDRSHGNYDVALSHAGAYLAKALKDGTDPVWKRGRVESWSRRWAPANLVKRAIIAAMR